MPAPSPDAAGRPAADSVFSASGDLATEVTRIADGDSRSLETLHTLDPDQVEGARAKKRLGLFFWIAAGFFILIVVSAITAPWLPIKDPAKIVGRPRLAPNATFWFGTDALGRLRLRLAFSQSSSAGLSELPSEWRPGICEVKPKRCSW